MKTTFKKATLALAVTASLGVSASASATVVDYSFNGAFTLLSSSGALLTNNAKAAYVAPWYGYRTAITGTLHFDTATGLSTGTVAPFQFLGDTTNYLFMAHDISFQSVGDGHGGAGTLLLGNMGFDFNGNVGFPVSFAMDGHKTYEFTVVWGAATQTDDPRIGNAVRGSAGSIRRSAHAPVEEPGAGQVHRAPHADG